MRDGVGMREWPRDGGGEGWGGDEGWGDGQLSPCCMDVPVGTLSASLS